jgi:hypothetical protein
LLVSISCFLREATRSSLLQRTLEEEEAEEEEEEDREFYALFSPKW